jgi:hypothetical protein
MPQTFVSSSNTFTFEYPDDWKLEKEDVGTLKLYKKGGFLKKSGQYILRITPMVSDEIISPSAYQALLTIRRKEHSDLQVIEKAENYIMNFHILKYKKEKYEDVGERTFLMLQDYWELIISNRIFTCWFSVRQGEETSEAAKEQKATAEQILYTIKLL